MRRLLAYSVFLLLALNTFGQKKVELLVLDDLGNPVQAEVLASPPDTLIQSNKNGLASFESNSDLAFIQVFYSGYQIYRDSLNLADNQTFQINLKPLESSIQTVEVWDENRSGFSMNSLSSIDGMGIYAGKKSEVLVPEKLDANKATNNARQVYARIPGVNIWESDGAGIQLGIGVRGLSPNRTANVNVRQNGYDISADALGYPESYYSPPLEGIEKIQFVRGAASLQYGTQFGGMLNFVMKDGGKEPLEVVSRQTVGSFGLFNSFNSIGGTKGKTRYYGFYQFKRGDGWRENSGFDVHTVYASLSHQINDIWTVKGDFTHMSYQAQQPGGLTDAQFEENPRQSMRNRNWFKVNWNLASLDVEGVLSPRTKVNAKVFGLLASRDALGYLGAPNRQDDEDSYRDLIHGNFENIGTEIRLLHRYEVLDKRSVALFGIRAYNGNSQAQQGLAGEGSGPNFSFLNDQANKSDYDFQNINYALFFENVFYLSDQFTITPGVRYEYIDTRAQGNYFTYLTNLVGDTLESQVFYEKRMRNRGVWLFGLGVSKKMSNGLEIYANLSKNYRAINFSDMRIDNPSLRIDPNIADESGYNADLGIRSSGERFRYDLSFFYLGYNNRIGAILMRDPVSFQQYRYRTNIASSSSYGLEAYGEWIAFQKSEESNFETSVFCNLSLNRAFYTSEENTAIDGNRVELTPEYIVRGGVRLSYKETAITIQVSHLGEQFTDATNAEFTPNGVNGMIPSYTVADLSLSQKISKNFRLEGGVNNLFNARYFTRRAVGYPGPGIIPSDGIGLYLTLEGRF